MQCGKENGAETGRSDNCIDGQLAPALHGGHGGKMKNFAFEKFRSLFKTTNPMDIYKDSSFCC